MGTPGVDANRSNLGLERALYQGNFNSGDAGRAMQFLPLRNVWCVGMAGILRFDMGIIVRHERTLSAALRKR